MDSFVHTFKSVFTRVCLRHLRKCLFFLNVVESRFQNFEIQLIILISKRFNQLDQIKQQWMVVRSSFRIAGYGLLGFVIIWHHWYFCPPLWRSWLGISDCKKSGWACTCTFVGAGAGLFGEKNLHIFKFYPGQVCSWGIVCVASAFRRQLLPDLSAKQYTTQ